MCLAPSTFQGAVTNATMDDVDSPAAFLRRRLSVVRREGSDDRLPAGLATLGGGRASSSSPRASSSSENLASPFGRLSLARPPVPAALDTTSGAAVSTGELRRMRLRVLQASCLVLMSVTLVHLLVIGPEPPAPVMLVVRLGGIACFGLMLVLATEATASRLGLGLTVMIKAYAAVRLLLVPLDQLPLETAVTGVYRLIPLFAAIFGGARAGVMAGVWAVGEIAAMAAWQSRQPPEPPLDAALLAALQSTVVGRRLELVATLPRPVLLSEFNGVLVITCLSCALVYFLERALGHLGVALDQRRSFISHMVWCPDKSRHDLQKGTHAPHAQNCRDSDARRTTRSARHSWASSVWRTCCSPPRACPRASYRYSRRSTTAGARCST